MNCVFKIWILGPPFHSAFFVIAIPLKLNLLFWYSFRTLTIPLSGSIEFIVHALKKSSKDLKNTKMSLHDGWGVTDNRAPWRPLPQGQPTAGPALEEDGFRTSLSLLQFYQVELSVSESFTLI